MEGGRQYEPFNYWKRAWHKWVVLTAAVIQLLCLWMNVKEYIDLSEAGIFSAAQWEMYTEQKYLQCAFDGMAAGVFLGIFLIGIWARSQRSARLAEGLLLLSLSLAWVVAGVMLQLAASIGNGIVWAFILLLAFAGGACFLWQSRATP